MAWRLSLFAAALAVLAGPAAWAKDPGGEPCPPTFQSVAGDQLSCTCDPSRIAGPVWGTALYTDDSSICAAAQHAGVIAGGGPVEVFRAPGQPAYQGSTRNGVTSQNYGQWGASFTFAPVVFDGAAGAPCPGTFTGHRGQTHVLTCDCAAPDAAAGANVWGSGPYTDDSDICRAALHAGAIGVVGGTVGVVPVPGQPGYAASTRNGVTTLGYGPWDHSFWFTGIGRP